MVYVWGSRVFRRPVSSLLASSCGICAASHMGGRQVLLSLVSGSILAMEVVVRGLHCLLIHMVPWVLMYGIGQDGRPASVRGRSSRACPACPRLPGVPFLVLCLVCGAAQTSSHTRGLLHIRARGAATSVYGIWGEGRLYSHRTAERPV